MTRHVLPPERTGSLPDDWCVLYADRSGRLRVGEYGSVCLAEVDGLVVGGCGSLLAAMQLAREYEVGQWTATYRSGGEP